MLVYKDCPECGVERIRSTVSRCPACQVAERYEKRLEETQARAEKAERERDAWKARATRADLKGARANRDEIYAEMNRQTLLKKQEWQEKLNALAENRALQSRLQVARDAALEEAAGFRQKSCGLPGCTGGPGCYEYEIAETYRAQIRALKGKKP